MSDLRTLLSEGVVLVNFIKDDGSERVMRATKNMALINYTFKDNGKKKKAPPTNVIPVWDLDLGQWRSIREDRIISWTLPEA